MPKKKSEWDVGDVFAVEQLDDNSALGQVLGLMMPNVVTCAFFDIRFPKGTVPSDFELDTDELISVASVTREQLDYGEWTIVGRRPVEIERDLWPNEKYRDKDWVGAKIYDAAILEDFLNAFYGLAPWDDWADPEYLDELLISPDKKPENLVYKGNATRPNGV